MAGTGNLSVYSKRIALDNFLIRITLKPKEGHYPDLLTQGVLQAVRCESSGMDKCKFSIALLKAQSLHDFISAYIQIDQEICYFSSPSDPQWYEVFFSIPKTISGEFVRCGDLVIKTVKSRYQYFLTLEINRTMTERSTQDNPSYRSLHVPRYHPPSSTPPPLANEESIPRSHSKVIPEKPPERSPENELASKTFLKIQNSFEQIQQRMEKMTSQMEILEGKIGSIHESVCYDGENQRRVYVLTLQKIFQEQAKKKLDQAKRSLKTYLSDPILQAIDILLTFPRSQASLYREFSEMCPNQQYLIRELTSALESFRKKYIPDLSIPIPEFGYNKKFSQFLNSDYILYLQKYLSCDQEPDESLLEPAAIYRKTIWLEFKRTLDEFNPVIKPLADMGKLKSEWDLFLFEEFIPRLRMIEQIEEESSWNPSLTRVIDQMFAVVLSPIELEIFPVEIGESYDPRKHEKDPIRSHNTTSTVTRVFNRGIKFKNRNDIYIPAKVSIG